MANFQSGRVALSFAMRNPKVADNGLPQVGSCADQVTERGWPPPNTQMRAERNDSPRENTWNNADLLQLLCGGVDSRRWCTWSSLWQRNHDCANERCKSPSASMQRSTIGMLP